MKRSLVSLFILLLVNLAVLVLAGQQRLEITLKHDDPLEQQTKAQLQRLLATYDLTRWLFTNKIVIESGRNVIPHSHPVLTLSVRHLKDDELLLSTFVHEQLHWWLGQNQEKAEAVVKELRQLYPKVPVDFPEGAQNEESTYVHLIVCYLEYRADRELLGELKALQVMQFWANDHYRWIYRTVLGDTPKIGQLIFQHKLVPGQQ